MLEKMFRCALIKKSGNMLLMEADFNVANKIVFGRCMIDHARHHNSIPDEIYSKQNCFTEDGTLTKLFFCDIVRQRRCPVGMAVVDADTATIE